MHKDANFLPAWPKAHDIQIPPGLAPAGNNMYVSLVRSHRALSPPVDDSLLRAMVAHRARAYGVSAKWHSAVM